MDQQCARNLRLNITPAAAAAAAAALSAVLLACLQPGVFGMSAQDQQAQLRQLLNQAQQRVPGMP
jgi:hypothetical protein